MVRYLVSPKWDNFIRSAVVAAFEAYGSALVGITPLELRAETSDGALPALTKAMQKG
jgi:hypothetical protein